MKVPEINFQDPKIIAMFERTKLAQKKLKDLKKRAFINHVITI